MRPSTAGTFAAGILTGAAVTVATIIVAAPAKADSTSRAYAWEYGPAICSVLDDHPTFSGLIGIGQAIVEQGLTPEQAGESIAYAVTGLCPRHEDLLVRFIVTFGPRQIT